MTHPKMTVALIALLAGIGAGGCTTMRHAQAADKSLAGLGAPTPLKFECAANLSVPPVIKILKDKGLIFDDQPLGDCYASANLNGSGKDELLMALDGSFYSGAGGNPLYIFTRDKGDWQMIANGSQQVFMDNVSIAAARTNGFSDIQAAGSDGKTVRVRLRFDGQQYRPAPVNP